MSEIKEPRNQDSCRSGCWGWRVAGRGQAGGKVTAAENSNPVKFSHAVVGGGDLSAPQRTCCSWTER